MYSYEIPVFNDLAEALEHIEKMVDAKPYCRFHLSHLRVDNPLVDIRYEWSAWVEHQNGESSYSQGSCPLNAVNALIQSWTSNQNAGGF